MKLALCLMILGATAIAKAANKPSYQEELGCVLSAYSALGQTLQPNTAVFASDASEGSLYTLVKNYPSTCRSFWPRAAAAKAPRYCAHLSPEAGGFATPACLAASIQAGRDPVTGN